jgi:hypothetical protein
MKPALLLLIMAVCLGITPAHGSDKKAEEASPTLTIHPKIFSYIEGWGTDEGKPLAMEINLDAVQRSANQFNPDEIRKEDEWIKAGRDGEGIWGYRVLESKGHHYTVAYAGGRSWLGASDMTIEFEIDKRTMKVDGKLRTVRVLRVLSFSGRKNALPTEAVRAMRTAQTSVLYSLGNAVDSEETLDGFKIARQKPLDSAQSATAVEAIDASISGWNGAGAMCFDPHHALRVTANGHTYDFVICYSCHHLRVYRDGTPLAQVEVSRSSNILDKMLDAAGVSASQNDQ